MEPVQTPKQYQREQKTDHQQEHEHMKSHNDPGSLKWVAGRVSLS